MMRALVVLVTAFPVIIVAAYGYRIGPVRFLGVTLRVWIPSALASAAVLLTARIGWFEPLGLVTPLLLGIVVAVTALVCLRRLRRPICSDQERRGLAPWLRALGLTMGAGVGLFIAAGLWMSLGFIENVTSPVSRGQSAPESGHSRDDLLGALVRTADRGFVCRLPWLGDLATEMDAVVGILNATPQACHELARREGWLKFRDLPSYREVVRDHALLRDLARASEGSLYALFRLQRNPNLLAFCREKVVWKALCSARPSLIARELSDVERALRTK